MIRMKITDHKRPLSDKVVDAILDKVQNGEIQLGEKLKPEDELAEELGVSRTSIREAIQKLKAIGVVKVKQGKGSFLCEEPSLESIRNVLPVVLMSTCSSEDVTKNLLQVRLILEPKVARLAAKKISDKKLNRLKQHIENLTRSAENRDAEAFFEHDLAFHLSLAEAADNPVLFFIIKTLKTIMFKQFEDVYSEVGFNESSIDFHRELFEALEDGDQDRAEYTIYRSIKIAYEGYNEDEQNDF